MSYQGPLDPLKMTKQARKAYQIWGKQRTRNKREYGSRAFVGWWLDNLKKKKWKDPTCGRIDHSKGYFFGNIEIQERTDNTKERNTRLGNPGKGKRVKAFIPGEGVFYFESKVEAAISFGIDPKTIWNRCEKRTTKTFNGPKNLAREVRFEWA